MSTLVASGRRIFIYAYTSLLLSQGTPIRVGILAWSSCWWSNRSPIIMLTVINTGITTGMEIVTRSVSAPLTSSADDYHFLVKNENGGTSINRQSLINMWMTFFASLLGGPVYFFKRRWSRFAFFVGFGGFNSILGGSMSSLIRDGIITLFPKRILFDLVYCGTFKFLTFELMRSPILAVQSSAVSVGALRIGQDFCNTLFRVMILNALKFKG